MTQTHMVAKPSDRVTQKVSMALIRVFKSFKNSHNFLLAGRAQKKAIRKVLVSLTNKENICEIS